MIDISLVFLSEPNIRMIPFQVFPCSGKVITFNPDIRDASEYASSSILLSPVDFLRKNKAFEHIVMIL